MNTLAKVLKDSNGNTIIPKTRAEQVYCSDNVPVSTKIANLAAMDTTLLNQINAIPSVDKSSIIYNCTCTKSGTVFSLTNSNLPSSATQNIIHISFIASADFNTGNTFKINNVLYTPISLDMTSSPPDLAFKSGALVSMDANINTKQCFFRLGGKLEPPIPDEPTDESSSYQIIQAFTTNTTWIVPESNWYRIIAIGKSGNGGSGANCSSYVNSSGGWGAGGNAGGIAASTLYLEKDNQFPITVNASATSFGSDISATAGGNGGNGTYNSTIDGEISPQYGDAYGGNKVNITGMRGTKATTGFPKQGGSGGYYQSDLTYISQYFVPSNTIDQYCAGGKVHSDDGVHETGKSYSKWYNLHVLVSGAGGGGTGGFRGDDGPRGAYPGGQGQPGVCIIEKAVK